MNRLVRNHMLTLLLLVAVGVFLIAGGQAEAKTALYQGQPAKYIFFFIGDGLGIPQRSAVEWYWADQKGDSPQSVELCMTEFPAQGMTTTHAANRFITGSAASATALATGYKTNINYIGVDPDFKPLKNIAEMAKEKGMRVGIVSTVSIDHATPAAFYAHVKTRKMYHEIDMALAESGFDFFAGGGLLDPQGKKSKSPLGDALEAAKKNGYTIVSNRQDFMALPKDAGKVLFWNKNLPDDQAMPYLIDRKMDEDVNLADITTKGIELLDNPKGFFMMIEGGKIDWACHANDARTAIDDTIDFDNAIKAALAFAEKHPGETLIVVTGDHECGGMTLGFAGTEYDTSFKTLQDQKISFQVFTDEYIPKFKAENISFEDAMKKVAALFGLKMESLDEHDIDALKAAYLRSRAGEIAERGREDYLMYGGSYDPFTVQITHLLNQKAGIAWTSYSHTGVPVATSAQGVGAEIFNGFYDNTDVAWKIMSVMGLHDQIQASGLFPLLRAVATK